MKEEENLRQQKEDIREHRGSLGEHEVLQIRLSEQINIFAWDYSLRSFDTFRP